MQVVPSSILGQALFPIVFITASKAQLKRRTAPLPSMDTHAYPGKGLSLSQLTFALNEELKRVAYRSS